MRHGLSPWNAPCILGNEHGNARGYGGIIGTVVFAVAAAVVSYFFPPAAGFFSTTTYSLIAGAAAVGGALGTSIEALTLGDQINRQQEIASIQIQTSQYGSPIPQVFGQYRLAGNVIWMGPKVAHEKRTESGGKKGKGKGPMNVNIVNTYTVDLAIAICDTQLSGPMSRILRVYGDNTLLYDVNQGTPTLPPNWMLYAGTEFGAVDAVIAFNERFDRTPGYPYLCYLRIFAFDMGEFPRVPNFTFVIEGPGGAMPLGDLTRKLLVASGLTEEQIDVEALPDAGVRFLLTSVSSVRAAMDQLMTAYRFFFLESEGKLVARTLALSDPVGVIPESDLDATQQAESQTTGLEILRERTRAFPTAITLSYPDPLRDYQPNAQQAQYNDDKDFGVARALSTAVALGDAQAKALVQESLDRVWLERNAYNFTLPRKWAMLEAGDRIAVESRGATYHLTIGELNYGRPGILQIRARGDSAMVMFVPGALPGEGFHPDYTLPYLHQTIVTFLNLPALTSEDQAPRLHVTYGYDAPADTGWPGATLHKSSDAGESYQLVHIGSTRVMAGTVATPLPDAPWWLTDTTSVITVVLEHGALHSVTPAQFQAGAIPAMLGNEMIQFREAELIAEQTYELRHFWRGRRGTGWATGTHVAGERLTILDSAAYELAQPLNERYVPRLWKGVTRGLGIDRATEQSYAMLSENLRPWRAASLLREQSGSDWVISWRGTARFSGSWIDGSQATPDPDFLAYRIVIYSDGTGTTIVRQVEQADSGNFQARQEYLYTAAQQTADFGSPQSVLYAQVFQVGRNDVSRPAAA